eukprot:CAMPEP_0204037428 /NCGR_PEP_ID=MMETSP0360-20130528/83272_1 /ASSEMBLY_ACC=CAM_ASM_000342 /TAXON_ID=268821 /ORGANISM="Scrippsiella Hangoei, Strain SHTV-5" /LENGTH=73 /DNA_ID=CAMNT_0050982837 /DNA_START=276 /DNA_END=494 /DNA_ORIENTATION=-
MASHNKRIRSCVGTPATNVASPAAAILCCFLGMLPHSTDFSVAPLDVAPPPGARLRPPAAASAGSISAPTTSA